MDRDAAPRIDGLAQARRRGIDQAALHAVAGDHEFAELAPGLACSTRQYDGHRLERPAGTARAEMFAPAHGTAVRGSCHLEAAIRRPQRRHRNAARAQPRHPGAIGSEPRPAAAAQRQHHHPRRHHSLALRRVESQRQRAIREVGKTQATMPHVELHTLPAQPVQPGAQQRRSLHVLGEHPAGTADEGVDAQARRPVTQLLSALKSLQQRFDRLAAYAVAGDEGFEGLGMRQVQPALAGQQELAPGRAAWRRTRGPGRRRRPAVRPPSDRPVHRRRPPRALPHSRSIHLQGQRPCRAAARPRQVLRARSAARSWRRSPACARTGRSGCAACTTSSSRVCTVASALRVAVDVEAVLAQRVEHELRHLRRRHLAAAHRLVAHRLADQLAASSASWPAGRPGGCARCGGCRWARRTGTARGACTCSVTSAQVLVQRLAERHHRMLADVVDAHVRRVQQPGHAGGVDDVAVVGRVGCAAASIIGVKTRTPCATPIRLTPSTHSQSCSVFSQIRPPAPTPALLKTKCGAPKRCSVAAASASTSAAFETSSRNGSTGAPSARRSRRPHGPARRPARRP